MTLRRTVDLLPEIFRTETNKKFLSATLDQLIQEPSLKRTQGYVGRRIGPGVNPADNYVVEPTADRTDYQLEPGIVFLEPETETPQDAITYPGIIDTLQLFGSNVSRQDRLFESQYYSWDPLCDLDKFSNYSQYYWLPDGPASVDVSATDVPLSNIFTVARSDTSYAFSGVVGNNPIITLARGGNYTFNISQSGHNFWIQTAPGINGRLPATPNISSRDVLGVINNGTDDGTVEFYVPQSTDQDFYFSLPQLAPVDLITNLKFSDINNVLVSAFLTENPTGIDGITSLDGKTLIFTNANSDTQSGGWQIKSLFDPLIHDIATPGAEGTYDTLTFDQTDDIVSQAVRYSVWQIQYISTGSGDYIMRLANILPVPNLSKFNIRYGAQYSNTQWYKNSSGYFVQVPLLTAVLDRLYYQDSTNPEIFGEIRLVDELSSQPLDINDIIGAKTYTSPNGVQFTNGLKVLFRGPTIPAQFQNLEYYVEGVGTGPGLKLRVGFIDGEAYFGPWHFFNGQKMTGAVHSTTTWQQYIFDTLEESILYRGAGGHDDAPIPQTSTDGDVIGNGIRLVPVRADIVTPTLPDYITISRASLDNNAWSRSNRWFHKEVLEYTAELNGNVSVINNDQRAKRPIIEFKPNLRLFNNGTQAADSVNIIDFVITDALSDVNGAIGYSIDGYSVITGTKIIFAADRDPAVRNKIYRVEFIDPNDSGIFIINLVEEPYGTPLINQTTFCLSGSTQQGKSFWFDGATWVLAQQKTKLNQAPLFDLYDQNGYSFSNKGIYPSSTFTGSRLFGYTDGGSSVVDVVLGFPLTFQNINNVGDILFTNYLYLDSFIYVKDRVSTTLPISNGFIRQYIDRTGFTNRLGWLTAAGESRSRQVFRFTYADVPLILDVPVDEASVFPAVQLFIEGIFVDPGQYTIAVSTTQTTITFVTQQPVGAIIEVQALSNVASQVGFYQIPLNLENNPFNGNSNEFTLGTIRNYYDSIGQNLKQIVGPINGANNSRDLGDITRYGTTIVQTASPLALTGPFLRQPEFDLLNSISWNSQEYQKFKAILMDLAGRGDFINLTPTQVLDSCLSEIAISKTSDTPFYWSDMIPSGNTYTEVSYTYTNISTPTFDTNAVYNFTSSNFQSLLIYVNGNILTTNYDYTVGVDSATVTITTPLSVGDVITIREYSATYGSFVPNTPTKMGLFPSYKPQLFLDSSYVEPTLVIRGHDGSITVAFNDYRDDVLLEYETRIFNNIKIQSEIPLVAEEVIPGQFRTTEYTLAEINEILAPDFLNWVGWNKLNYTDQYYRPDSPFTYNYSQSSNRLNGQPLLGAWRGIYNYFYDTINPNVAPWEMLGFSQEPTWWQEIYGPAPYTSGNLVLWQDLEKGYIADPINPRIDPLYVRPGLTQVIPSASEGELLPPLIAVVGNYDRTSFQRSWAFGDDGPVESTWRTSSAWPFAVMRLLALTKTAKFFSLFADRDRYVYNSNLNQYLWDDRYRLAAKNLTPLYGNGTSKASYINWIIDYNQQRGVNSSQQLTTTLANLDVRLCWRLAAFSDKKYLKIYTERSTPGGTNAGLLLPDESYQILLYKNPPFAKTTYSSIVVQATDDGWAVYGYNNFANYFEILASRPTGKYEIISAGGSSERVPVEYSNTIVRVPYGFVFTSRESMCDFITSYGELLSRKGITLEGVENGYIMNWRQMAQEFLYWSNQGWAPGSIVNLNPAATKLSASHVDAVVENIQPPRLDSLVLNQNKQVISPAELIIDRLDNTFSISTATTNSINFLNLRFTAYEHMVILNNRSIFADLIYDPITGARQSRVLVSGVLTGDWNGQVRAPGFVLNQNNVPEWKSNLKYSKGEIVKFKNQYWSASTIIKPSAEFDYAQWIKSDYGQIQHGLLPNAANASDQLSQAYSVYDANLEQEVDIFSYGLIGFRPRQYMQALNLDDVSQVQLYQQFLGTKGTTRATDLFSLANLGKEVAEYSIYEHWGMLQSTYGANANNSFFELLLKQALLTSDPFILQVTQPGLPSQADQTIFVEDIWKSSYKITSPNILPTLTVNNPDVSLPGAGYVSLDDVDVTVFDLTDTANIQSILTSVGIGTTIWVAAINSYNWGVFRVQAVPGQLVRVEDNLNGASIAIFDKVHGLTVGSTLIVKNFDDAINGVYTVQAIPSIYSVVINFNFDALVSYVDGTGLGLTLLSNRVAQPSDIPSLPFADQLEPGVKVWVDNDGVSGWTVLEKTDPFVSVANFVPEEIVPRSRFGEAISQGLWNLTALVGAPGFNPAALPTAPGAIYVFGKGDNNSYFERNVLELPATNAQGYGSAIDIGNQNWAVVGAHESNANQGYATTIFVNSGDSTFAPRQLLVAPDEEFGPNRFGYSVVISANERWMFIGAPWGNRVYAYTRVDIQEQTVTYLTSPEISTYNYSNSIVIDSANPNQLLVVLDNVELVSGVDYTITNTDVNLTLELLTQRKLVISRRQSVLFDFDSSATFPLDAYLQTATNIYSFTVTVGGVLYRPNQDYEFDDITTNLNFLTLPNPDEKVLVESKSYFKFIETLTIPGLDPDARFGFSVSCATNGQTVLVGAPGVDELGGVSYAFSRNVQAIQVADNAITDYYPVQSLSVPGDISVSLNGNFLVNTYQNIDGTFSVNTTNPSSEFITVLSPLEIGDIIEIETNQFALAQIIEADTPTAGSTFGYKLDQCSTNCSLYISAPYDSEMQTESGKVEVWRNQSRLYGTTTSTIANPALTTGDYLRINDYYVECVTGSAVADMLKDIKAAKIPNVTAALTPNVELIGDGTTKLFDIGTVYSAATSYTPRVFVDLGLQILNVDYVMVGDEQIQFVVAPTRNAVIEIVSGRLIINVVNYEAAPPRNKLTVSPGLGTLFDDLGFNTYVYQQTLRSPVIQAYSYFGKSLFINDTADVLLVGAPNGSMIDPCIFDNGTTIFDSSSTTFTDVTAQSGVVYSFDALRSANPSVDNPTEFVFGQQFTNNSAETLDNFGAAVNYTTGTLLIGAPCNVTKPTTSNYGTVYQYLNADKIPAWKPIRVQVPSVDVSLINTIYMYDLVSGKPKQYFDFFDPLQGKLLGVVRQNINFIGAIDPAAYNEGVLNNYGQKWAQSRVGQIWWDTAMARFIDPHQNDSAYASQRWGQLFPGSQIQMYQWVASSLPPSQYTGQGQVKDVNSFSVVSNVNEQGFLETIYYFWVTGLDTIATNAGKTLSTNTISRYIESPRSSGISYFAPLNASTYSIYNGLSDVNADDTVLHIEFDKIPNDDPVYVEYQLVTENRPESFLTPSLYRKFLDSMSGANSAGNAVPDPTLSPSNRYGVDIRPRQSMVVNRFLALKNYIERSNEILALYPISEIRKFTILNSSEPPPNAASGQYNKQLANTEELAYQNLGEVPLGYKYLVDSDSTNAGLWSIYEVVPDIIPGSKTYSLYRVQNYNTKRFWNYIDWYAPTYVKSTKVLLEVSNYNDLLTLTVPNGSVVKITANSQNKWELYKLQSGDWIRVAVQDGTIAIAESIWNYSVGNYGFDSEVFDAQFFDETPTIETRKILEAINQELFIDELLIERNRLIIILFNFILSEQRAPNWLIKTSLIDVDHVIRNLLPYQVYRRDNQDFVRDYIEEVKPYHVQIREFNLKYNGFDSYLGSLTDFDLPAYWDSAQGLFISPVLDNTGQLSTTSSVPGTSNIWQTFPWNQWYNNYLLTVEDVNIPIGGGGANYTEPPVVTVTGDCISPAILTAQINSSGQVSGITILDPGSGYSTTAIISLSGGNGSGAQAVAVMGNGTVRNLLTTIKYDRYEYHAAFIEWQANVVYLQGDRVRYANRVWEANAEVQTAEFEPDNWTIITANVLSGVDRTMGYYTPTVNQTGLDLALLISGVDYPGVQVMAPVFADDPGFDIAPFDSLPYDNLAYGPEGRPTYDPVILDAIYESDFTDPYLGTLPAPAYAGNPPNLGPNPIVVDGGAFVDTYESHAPEELVPGISYDTLDLRVYTTPGADWLGQGYGFPIKEKSVSYDGGVISFENVLPNTIVVTVYNVTTGQQLIENINITIDYIAQTIAVLDSANIGDTINISLYSLGGGNQLYTNSYVGDEIGNSVVIPVDNSLIVDFAIFVNGDPITDYTWESTVTGSTRIDFATSFTSTELVTITAMGDTAAENTTWSAPVTQVVESDGSLSITLDNFMGGTNSVNAIVDKNGTRARPPEGAEYLGDGTTTQFALPNRGGFDLSLVTTTEVSVWKNNEPQVYSVDFILEPAISVSERYISFATTPDNGDKILITVSTVAQYTIVGNTITFIPGNGLIPVVGDIISVTSFNNTNEQDILTEVFVGTVKSGVVVSQPYDSTLYDIGSVNGGIGTFDYSEGSVTASNIFDTGREITDTNRLIVTLDGDYQFNNIDYIASGSSICFNGPLLNDNQVIVITNYTQNTVPSAMAFRIFQDMRGQQRVYRITPATTTFLAAPLDANADIIYVNDASKCTIPSMEYGIFGIITINGERITYRTIDLINNTLSGLRRGTAGTGADAHLVGASVYNMGSSNLLPNEYQNYVQQQLWLGDGSTTVFTATDIAIVGVDSTELIEAVEVYVGGILQTSGYTVQSGGPVTVEFDTAPESGYQIKIAVSRGVTWYQPGESTPSNGVPLQLTETTAARFLQGVL